MKNTQAGSTYVKFVMLVTMILQNPLRLNQEL